MTSPVAPAAAPSDDLAVQNKRKHQRKGLVDQVREAVLDVETHGLSRRQLAKLLDISMGSLSNIANGRHGVSGDVLDRIGRVLNLRIVVSERRLPRKKKGTKR